MWLESLLDRITCFIPRPLLMQPNEGGFRQTPKPWNGWPWTYWPWISWEWLRRPWQGKPWSDKDKETNTWVIELKPGMWYWLVPLIMEHLVIPIKVQPKDIRIQSVWTKDGHNLCIGGAIRYYVQKPIKAILEVDDYDQSLQIIALAKICEFVRQHTLAELREGMTELKKQILEAVREGSSGWGLRIQEVDITDIGEARNFRLLASNSIIVGADR